MWHWLRNSERDQLRFLCKLLAIVISSHVLLIGMLFFAYRDYTTYHLAYTKATTPAVQQPVIFLPLYKRASEKRAASKAASTQQKATMPHHASPAPSTKKKTPSKQEQEKKSADTSAEKTRFVEGKKSSQSTQKKNIRPKTVKKQHSPKKEQPPALPKHDEPTKKVEAPSIPSVSHEQPTMLSTDQELITEYEPLYIGQEEKFMIALQQALHDEICTQWQVPTGLSKDLSCQISVLVNWQGVVQEVCIAQSSGVRMYDASARVAATTMKLPKIAWGKEFIITFKQ
jgi:TonB-like protein